MEIILGGRVLDIDPENIEGYFTFCEAKKKAEESGKRLMTKEELGDLCECKGWWDKKRKGRVFRIPTPNGSLAEVFFPAFGYREKDGKVNGKGRYGYYWSFSAHSCTHGYSMSLNNCSSLRIFSPRQEKYSVRLIKDAG